MRTEKKRERRSKLKRSVEVNGKDWEWQMSSGMAGVVIRSPDGNLSKVDLATFTGMTSDEVEAILNDWEESVAVTPLDVKEYIKKNMEELR